MNSIQRNNINTSKSIHNLSCSIYHFKDIDKIHRNTYAITIHLRNKGNIDLRFITKTIHQLINKAIVNNKKPRNKQNAGLLLNFDVEGTREFKPVTSNYILPHVHGCIFLQPNTIKNRCNEEIISCIKREIYSNKYLESVIKNIWIKKFKPKNGTLLNYISYSSKAENYEAITSNINQTTFIYPYENKIHKSNIISEKLHENDKQIVKEIADIGNRIETIANIIATQPLKIFGFSGGLNVLADFIELYMKNNNNQKPYNFKNVFSFIKWLIKSDKARVPQLI